MKVYRQTIFVLALASLLKWRFTETFDYGESTTKEIGDYKHRHFANAEMITVVFLYHYRQLRLVLFFKVVEGLVPALPPETFLTPRRTGRLVHARHQPDYNYKYNTSNVVDNFVRNNDRCFQIPTCRTAQFKNSFFTRTAAD